MALGIILIVVGVVVGVAIGGFVLLKMCNRKQSRPWEGRRRNVDDD